MESLVSANPIRAAPVCTRRTALIVTWIMVKVGALIPPLAGADYLANNQANLPCLIRKGIQDTIVVNGKVYAEKMPGQ